MYGHFMVFTKSVWQQDMGDKNLSNQAKISIIELKVISTFCLTKIRQTLAYSNFMVSAMQVKIKVKYSCS